MRAQAGISGNQMKTILADIRAKFGRKAVEAGNRKATTEHNSQYSKYFTAEITEFEDKDGKLMKKPLVYCSSLLEFLEKVEEFDATP